MCSGKAGNDGKDGTNGTNGADGKDGVSVTSAVEQAGGNCANGGSKFTAVNGVTYACNGQPGTAAPLRAGCLPAFLDISPDGSVGSSAGTQVSLSGVIFRAD